MGVDDDHTLGEANGLLVNLPLRRSESDMGLDCIDADQAGGLVNEEGEGI